MTMGPSGARTHGVPTSARAAAGLLRPGAGARSYSSVVRTGRSEALGRAVHYSPQRPRPPQLTERLILPMMTSRRVISAGQDRGRSGVIPRTPATRGSAARAAPAAPLLVHRPRAGDCGD